MSTKAIINGLKASLAFVVLLLCAEMFSCTEDDTVTENNTVVKKSEIRGLFSKEWLLDIDGNENVDFGFLQLYLSETKGKSKLKHVYYDEESGSYKENTFPLNVEIGAVSRSNGLMGRSLVLRMDPSGFTKEQADLKEEFKENDFIFHKFIIGDITENNLNLITEYSGEEVTLTFANASIESMELDKAGVSRALKMEVEEKTYAPSRASSRNLKKWMAGIPDERKVKDLSIPGAHDAATYKMNELLTFAGQTQSLTIEQQWDKGCRVFDLRPRYESGKVKLFHEFLDCGVTADDALKMIVKKIKENETEGAIIIVRPESNQIGDLNLFKRSIVAILDAYADCGISITPLDAKTTMNKFNESLKKIVDKEGMLAKYDPNMTMKDLRGKILVIQRDSSSDVYNNNIAIASSWSSYSNLHNENKDQSCSLFVQDNWGSDDSDKNDDWINEKKYEFSRNLTRAKESSYTNAWFVNCASGYTLDKAIPDYATAANQLYPQFIESIDNSDSRGIIMQDFIGLNSYKRMETWRGLAVSISASTITPAYGIRKIYTITALKASYLLCGSTSVYGQDLVEAVIENNF